MIPGRRAGAATAAAAAVAGHPGLMGAVNPDNRCYAIACLAMFLMLPQGFVAKEPMSPVLAALRALCRRRWRVGGGAGVAQRADLDPILTVMPHKEQQEDAHEFFRKLTAHIESQGGEEHLAKLFRGEIQTETTCSACGEKSCVTNPMVEFTIELAGAIRSMHDYFDKRFHRVGVLDGPNAWTGCPRCAGPTRAEVRQYVTRFPRYMMVLLSRFRSYGGGKDNTSVCFERTVQVNDETGGPIRTYVLVSVVHHSGTLAGGHYYCYCWIRRTWWLFNDEVVAPMSPTAPVASGETPYILLYRLKPLDDTGAAAAAKDDRSPKRPRCFPE